MRPKILRLILANCNSLIKACQSCAPTILESWLNLKEKLVILRRQITWAVVCFSFYCQQWFLVAIFLFNNDDGCRVLGLNRKTASTISGYRKDGLPHGGRINLVFSHFEPVFLLLLLKEEGRRTAAAEERGERKKEEEEEEGLQQKRENRKL
mmetsp:Transcript_17317/g.30406  ORF Transcript_17317/g.30406 Transcript_17317/m.30406 type:complete len:152 (+) Transcript_17317:452-907(+)